MKLRFAGIRRKTEFSPNHEVNDLLIINQTAENLRQLGADVNLYDEDSISSETVREELIFSMVQGPKGIEQLFRIEKRGSLIINSPESVYSCYRSNMLRKLPEGGIPIPTSVLVSTDMMLNGEVAKFNSRKLWIKRSDVHAVRKEDVIEVNREQDEINCMLENFHKRQINKVILQESIQGNTVKFYAVRETDFFYWYYTDAPFKPEFQEKSLRDLASASAEILGLYVYGGDAIIDQQGKITIIDINDWPSFAPIRQQASKYISELLYRRAKEYVDGN